MAAFFALTAVMTVLVLISVLGIVWESRFTAYTRENLQNTVDTTALNMSQAYARAEGWNADVLSIARQASATNSDIGIQVLDVSGVVLYDDSAPNARRPGGNSALSGLRRVTLWFMQLSKTYKVSLWAALEFGRLVLNRS